MLRRARPRTWGSAALVLLWLAASSPLTSEQPPSLEERIRERLEAPAARRAVWGIDVVEIESGQTIFQHNPDTLFVPASNAKLYATALALNRLGPDYRFTTRVVGEARVEEGVLGGSLRLIGGGDPNLSARVIPYDPKIEYREDRLEPIRELARQVAEAGVNHIEGDIIGDDTRFVWDPYPNGWSLDDVNWDYGAPVSALSVNDNRIEILVRPGAAGQPARLRLKPEVDYYTFENRTETKTTRRVARRLEMRVRGPERIVDFWGEISIRSPGREMNAAIAEPALFAAIALKAELEALGITVDGKAKAAHSQPYEFASLKDAKRKPEPEYPVMLAQIISPPLSDALSIVNKSSQNLHAEILLREVGYQRRGVGSLEAGIEEMRDFLEEAGLSPWEFYLSDGSGLARKNLVSPEASVKLLRSVWASDNRQVYVDSLPIGGEDGTLDWRFSRSPAKGRIHAKTGSLSHVTALSGYATRVDGTQLAFSAFVNNFGVSSSYIRKILDDIIEDVVMTPGSEALSSSAAGSQ
ncbi:MAG: D-alanyl-D-alanine carboxypeptidase/D-alanyl-D-alanine-endopeptidase [Bryobacterales bacterium]